MLWFNQLKGIPLDFVGNSKLSYANIPCGFDTETTSCVDVNGEKAGFIYEFTFGLGTLDNIVYGRTIEQFIEIVNYLSYTYKLSSKRRLICYVHNFPFEFQFIRKYFTWLEVFAVANRKPIKALCKQGIEFRDSYILSGLSLEKVGDNLQKVKVKKLVGNLDYDKIRFPETKLTDEELAYCENDVAIILAYITEQIELYGDISKIPLTNTGRVRQYTRNVCYRKGFKKYSSMIKKLTLDYKEYDYVRNAFQGGFTHANSHYVGKILTDVSSIDFTSSYPTVMIAEKFPMSKGTIINIEDEEQFYMLINKYCCIFEMTCYNLRQNILQENYISISRCYPEYYKSYLKDNKYNIIINNGRVVQADKLTLVVTNVDFNIIKECYSFDCEIGRFYKYIPGYLPRGILETCLELYRKKTELKNVEGKEQEYLLSKGMLNSLYGMSVTRIVRPVLEVDEEGNFIETNLTDEELLKISMQQIDEYNSNPSRFLYYVWGIFITAYARANLFTGILNIGKPNFKSVYGDYVYSDTDSIKFLNYKNHLEYINKYNEVITEKLNTTCLIYSLDRNNLAPLDIKGISHPLGIWDYEGTYKRFKTLGAKRYMYEDEKGIHITIAGLNKKIGADYIAKKKNPFVFFNNKMDIPPDNTGKLTHIYIDNETTVTCKDYLGNEYTIKPKSGIYLEKAPYYLSLSDKYLEYLSMARQGLLRIGEEVVND